MGIDPVTHQPLFPPSDQDRQQLQHDVPKQLQKIPPPPPPGSCNNMQEASQGTTTENSYESALAVNQAAEDKTNEISSGLDDPLLESSSLFCTDEVPLIQPHEILLPCDSSSSSSSNSSNNQYSNDQKIDTLEYLDFSCMEWIESNSMLFWNMDDMNTTNWDFLCEDGDSKVAVDSLSTQYQQPRMAVHEYDPWKF